MSDAAPIHEPREVHARQRVRVRIWDAPTRLFHWTLAAAFAFCWYTAENDQMAWHRWSGYAILGLLAFRIYWGLVGASTARFANFVKGPRAIGAYLRALAGARGAPAARLPDSHLQIGHNPLGALSVIALLALLIVQTILGLYAVDVDGIESGPLSQYVDFDTGRAAAKLHHLAFNALLVLVGLHLSAIAFYLFIKRDNLIGPMVSGRKTTPDAPGAANVTSTRDASDAAGAPGAPNAAGAPGAPSVGAGRAGAAFAPLWRLLPGLAIAAALVAAVMKGFKI